jgi:hypothetical protein
LWMNGHTEGQRVNLVVTSGWTDNGLKTTFIFQMNFHF